MCKILPRIKEIALKEGITIGALERVIGASKGVLSRAIANGTDIQSKWIQAIVENYPQYSAQWLLTGTGDMLATPRANSAQTQGHENEFIKNEKSATTGGVPLEVYNSMIDRYEGQIHTKDETIGNLREEIGRLKARIEMLETDGTRKNNPSYAHSMKPEIVET